MRNLTAVLGCLLVAAACGGDAKAPPTTTPPQPAAASPVAPESSSPPTSAVPPTTGPAALPGVAALTSGRGDDGSLEVGVWLATDPFGEGASILIGTDSDDSYPGVGDPVPHIDGWLDIGPAGVTLVDGGAVVTDDTAADFADWVSWTGRGRTFWVYFLQTVPVRAGSLWVVVEIDGAATTGMVAGVPVGDGCSYHGGGVDLGTVPSDVPQLAGPCRYP